MNEFVLKEYVRVSTAISTVVVAFVVPLHTMMLAIGALIFIDTITGVWASVKKGERISSHRFGDVILKCTGYLIGIVSAWVAQTYIVPDIPIVQAAVVPICLRDLLSIYENISVITGKQVSFKLPSKVLNEMRERLLPRQRGKVEQDGPAAVPEHTQKGSKGEDV